MTRTFILTVALMSLVFSTAFAVSLPGQDIKAHAALSYCTQSQINASACVDFTDATNTAAQSASQPSSATIETSLAPVSAGPATAFVAPNAGAPLYCTTTSSLYYGPSLVGKQVKIAGTLFVTNGAAYIDDGASVAGTNGLMIAYGVPLRTDLISTMPANGTRVTIQGVVRMESDGQLTLLPLANSGLVTAQ